MELTTQELALVHFVKALPFEALLDAGNGIEKEAKAATLMAIKLEAEGNPNAAGFRVRAHELEKIAEMLGYANADYRAHIMPDEARSGKNLNMQRTKYFIDGRANGLAESFEQLAEHARNGWTISSINAVHPVDGQYRFTLIRPDPNQPKRPLLSRLRK